MIREFLFAVALFAAAAALIVGLLGSLALLHRYTHSQAAFWAWLAGALIYLAAGLTCADALFNRTGFAEWVMR